MNEIQNKVNTFNKNLDNLNVSVDELRKLINNIDIKSKEKIVEISEAFNEKEKILNQRIKELEEVLTEFSKKQKEDIKLIIAKFDEADEKISDLNNMHLKIDKKFESLNEKFKQVENGLSGLHSTIITSIVILGIVIFILFIIIINNL